MVEMQVEKKELGEIGVWMRGENKAEKKRKLLFSVNLYAV